MKQGKEKEESFTEIDLLHGDRIVTIRRNITSDSKASKWQMDRRKVTEKEIKVCNLAKYRQLIVPFILFFYTQCRYYDCDLSLQRFDI